MTALLALMRKDLVLTFSNRRALLLGIVVPVVIAAFFGSLFGGKSDGPSRVALIVTDLDRSPLSRQLVEALQGDTAFDLRELPDDTAAAQVKAGEAVAALVLPQGFGRDAGPALFSDARRPEITLHYDPSQGMALQLVKGLLTEHVMQTVSSAVFSGDNHDFIAQARDSVLHSTALDAPRRQDLMAMLDSVERLQRSAPVTSATASTPASAAGAGGLRLPFAINEEATQTAGGAAYNAYAHSFAGMSVQFILFSGIELGIGLLMLRRMDLWKRLRAAPLSKRLLLGSRVASGAVTALALLAGIYAAAMAFFGVRIDGSVIGFAGVAIAFALMTASFGLLIAAIGRTPEATRPLAVMATLMLVMLGGAWVPSFVFPEWLQRVSLAAPTRWAVDGLDAMTWRGLGLESALAPIGVMLGCALVCGALALWRFDWEE